MYTKTFDDLAFPPPPFSIICICGRHNPLSKVYLFQFLTEKWLNRCSSRSRRHHLMQGSHTPTNQEIAGRTTVIISDVLIKKERILSHVIGSGEITFLCVQENGSVLKELSKFAGEDNNCFR